MSLDSRRMLYFLRIAEFAFSSLARARKASVSPSPHLSHHVRQLEEDLGVILLVRRPRGVTVTEAGANLVEHARAVVQRIEEAERDLRKGSRELTGTVRLGLASSLAAPLTPLLSQIVGRPASRHRAPSRRGDEHGARGVGEDRTTRSRPQPSMAWRSIGRRRCSARISISSARPGRSITSLTA